MLREAGRFSNWTNPDDTYEEALRALSPGCSTCGDQVASSMTPGLSTC